MVEPTIGSFGLVAVNGPRAGQIIPLDATAGVVTLGRDVSREIPLDDPLASRLHARLHWNGTNWQLEDCGSSNGTRVNLQFVERSLLQPGDLVGIGERLFVFSAPGSDAPRAAGRVRVLGGATAVRVPATPDAETAAARVLSSNATRLALLYRFAASLPSQGSVRSVLKAAVQTVRQGTGCRHTAAWLRGTDGRLRCVFQEGEPLVAGPLSSDRVQPPELLTSLVLEQEEAIALAADGTECDDASQMAAPLAGRQQPRGAIHAVRPAGAVPFGRAELDFLVAIAQQTSVAVELLEQRERLERANDHLRRRIHTGHRLMGESEPVRSLIRQIERVAPTESNVLIRGESGTGKELVAQTLHEMSRRAEGPFLAVNCAAFNESLLESELFGHESGAFTGADHRRLGQFERAHQGTIFLDEVGELSATCQAKLLRILEGHPFERLGGSEPICVDVRLLAATHRNLEELVAAKQFRQDLYFRLRVIELQVPPLRERGDDIVRLAAHFLEHFRGQLGRGPVRFSPQAADGLLAYHWPGNVRELRNAVERAVVLGEGDDVQLHDLAIAPDPNQEPSDPCGSLCEAEMRHIRRVMKVCNGNKTQACKMLGIGRATLYSKLRASAPELL